MKRINPLSRAFTQACAANSGIAANPDFNGDKQSGSGFFRVTQNNGRRWSAANTYLRPALRRGNLTVWPGIHTTRILTENGRAVGVEYLQNGSTDQVRATREVIVSAGAVGSPRLLLLSGIGPAAQLEPLGIPVAADLPGVGENLQDHLNVGVSYLCTDEFRSTARKPSGI